MQMPPDEAEKTGPPTAPATRGYGSPPAGAELKGARLSQGRTLEDVRQATGIATSYLEAMEAGDPSHMPGRAFNHSYIRTYVQFLDIENYFDHSVEWYIEKLGTELGAESADHPWKRSDRGRARARWSVLIRGMTVAAIVAMVVAVAAGGWFGLVQVQLLDVVDPPSAVAAGRLSG